MKTRQMCFTSELSNTNDNVAYQMPAFSSGSYDAI